MLHEPSTTFSPAHLAALLGALNAELNGQTMGAMLQLLQDTGLSMPRLVALLYLRRQSSATISQLSEHLNLTLGSTSQAIDQLVQSGLVERHEDSHDRRHKVVTLTATGQEVVGRVRQFRLDETARRFSELAPELRERLGADLVAVLEALQIQQPTLHAV